MTGYSRRETLSLAGSAAITASLHSAFAGHANAQAHAPLTTAERRAADESFWRIARDAFDLDDGYTNLRTLWTGRMPQHIEDAVCGYLRSGNVQRPENIHYKGRTFTSLRMGQLKSDIARFFNAPESRFAITQSTTEALMNVMMGLDLAPGDEVVTTRQDYHLVLGSLAQRSARDGITVRYADLPLIPESPQALVDAVMAAVTPRTRAIFVCHVYYSGIVFPVRMLKEALGDRDILVGVDGALAVGHVSSDLEVLGCDAYGGSFHKAAGGPQGTGFLYLKEEWIQRIWPLFGNYHVFQRRPVHAIDDISKFEHYGRRPQFSSIAISDLLEFLDLFGEAERIARFQYLKTHWTSQLVDVPNIRFLTPLDPALSCGLIAMQIQNVAPGALDRYLLESHQIMVASTMIESIDPLADERYRANALWLNPNIFTSRDEMDRFTEIIQDVARNGIPA